MYNHNEKTHKRKWDCKLKINEDDNKENNKKV